MMVPSGTMDAHFYKFTRAMREQDHNESAFVRMIDSIIKRSRFLSPLDAATFTLTKPLSASYGLTSRYLQRFQLQDLPLATPVYVHCPGLESGQQPAWDVNETVSVEPKGQLALHREEIPPFEFVQPTTQPSALSYWLKRNAYRFAIDIDPYELTSDLVGEARREDRGVKVIQAGNSETHYNLNFLVRYYPQLTNISEFEILIHEFAHVILGHLGPLRARNEDKRGKESDRNRVMIPDQMKEFEAETATYMVERILGIESSSAELYYDYVAQESHWTAEWLRGFSITRVAIGVRKLCAMTRAVCLTESKSISSKHPLHTPPEKPWLDQQRDWPQNKVTRDDCIDYFTFEKQRRFRDPLTQGL